MPNGGPSFRPRPGGGFNPGMGGFGEHLDENAVQQAMGQKQSAQQGAQVSPQQMQQALQSGQKPGGTTQQTPREVGNLAEELVQRPLQDIAAGLKSLFDLNTLLGISPKEDDPQTKAKKQQMLQRFNRLTQEEQEYARQKYQAEMQKKQQEEQEKEMKRRQQQQAESNTIQAPSGTKKGPQGPGGSKKQKAVTKLQNDRKQLGGPQSSN